MYTCTCIAYMIVCIQYNPSLVCLNTCIFYFFQLNFVLYMYMYIIVYLSSLSRASDPEGEEERAMEREMSVLCGVIEHLLPRVGSHVRTLDLAYGKAVTNEVVRPLN